MKPLLALLAAVLLLAGCSARSTSWQEVSTARGGLTPGRWSYGPSFHISGGVVSLSGVVATGEDPFEARLGLATASGDGPPEVLVTKGAHLSGRPVRDFGSVEGTTASLKTGTYRIAVESNQPETTGFVMNAYVRK